MSQARQASLLVIFLTVFIDLLGFGMVLPLLPIYGKQFAVDYGLSEQQIGWMTGLLMSSFSAMQFLFAPLWGRLSDRIGRRPVLIVGLLGSVVFYFLFGIATVRKSLWLLFATRIGAGIAGATISTAQAYIADITTLENRTKGMALIGAAFGIGFTFGPLFGALALDWRSEGADLGPGPGYAAAALSLGALLIAIFRLEESLDASRKPSERKWFSSESLRHALATPSLGLLLLASFVSVFSFANFESTLSLIVKDEQGAFDLTPRQVLFVFAFIGLTLTIIQGGVVRRLSGKVADAKLAIMGAGIMIVGFALLAYVSSQGSIPLLLTALAIEVCGFAFFTPSINALVSRRSDPAQQGGILGVLQSTSSLARILGPVVGLRLFHTQVVTGQAHSPQLPMGLAAALMLVGMAVLFVAAPRGRDFGAAEPAVTE